MTDIATFLLLTIAAAASSKADIDELPRCPADLAPIVALPPVYPATPISGKLEGWVRIKFILWETGQPKQPEVVESSSMLFERSALQAILKFKYPVQKIRCQHQARFEYLVE